MDGSLIEQGTPAVPHPAVGPERDADGKLTRAGMEHVINNGGSVLFQPSDKSAGGLATKIEHLPSAAALAKGKPQEEKAVKEDLQKKMADLQVQIDELKGAADADGPAETEAETDADGKPVLDEFGNPRMKTVKRGPGRPKKGAE